MKKQIYHQDIGHVSKSGKTIIRISKSGNKYYFNPVKHQQSEKERKEKLHEEGKDLKGKYIKQRVVPLCYDNTSPAYMKYYEQKCELREEYPSWIRMTNQEHKEYFRRLWELLQGEDFQHFLKVDSRTLEEKNKDEWWKNKEQKDKDYDGHGDDYSW